MVVLKTVFLKKIKGSTLIESLVASVIIIIIFTIASLTLNNVFQSSIKNNVDRVQNRINTLEYLYLNDRITYPYHEDFEDWEIQLIKSKQNNGSFFVLEAKQLNTPSTKQRTKKSISRKLTYAISE